MTGRRPIRARASTREPRTLDESEGGHELAQPDLADKADRLPHRSEAWTLGLFDVAGNGNSSVQHRCITRAAFEDPPRVLPASRSPHGRAK